MRSWSPRPQGVLDRISIPGDDRVIAISLSLIAAHEFRGCSGRLDRNQAWDLEMSDDTLLSQLRELMVDVFDVDDVVISTATTAEDIEEWDSLSHVRLIVAVERKFGVKFRTAEIESLKSVGDLVALVTSKTG